MATLTPDGKKITLKYLFKADFDDGTSIIQNKDDQSSISAERSGFYDVLQAVEQGKKAVKFSLHGNGHEYSVDLTDGHFEIDGVPFIMHEQVDLINFRILYFRVRDNHFNQAGGFINHDISYRIGWQANHKDGVNEQHYIEIN